MLIKYFCASLLMSTIGTRNFRVAFYPGKRGSVTFQASELDLNCHGFS